MWSLRGLNLLRNEGNTRLGEGGNPGSQSSQSQCRPGVHKVLDSLTMQILEFNGMVILGQILGVKM